MKPAVLFQLTLCAAFAATPPALATARAAPRIHVVSSGQRLESIAKRYGVSVEALRAANDLGSRSLLKVGQRLSVPTRRGSERATLPGKAVKRSEKHPGSAARPASISSAVAPVRHRVTPGETLGGIARRAGTTVEVLSASNRLSKGQPLRVGQVLVLPGVGRVTRKGWHSYARAPKRKGYLELSTSTARFSGPAVDSDGRLRPQAVRAMNELLSAGGSHPALPERLIRLLIEVSNTFGGRPLRLVSGYRTASYYQDSRHKVSSAVDFLVVGVPNAAVCEYLKELEDVGVGFYPNSSFVHLDVRDHSAYWVDYAGPGEPPRSTPNAPTPQKRSRPVRSADRKLLAELDGVLEQTKTGIQTARIEPPRDGGSSSPGDEREHRVAAVPAQGALTAALDSIAMRAAARRRAPTAAFPNDLSRE